jgi:ankyrin repeat protein
MLRRRFLVSVFWAAAALSGALPVRADGPGATVTSLDLVRAAAAGDAERLRHLLAVGADPNAVTPDWRSSLIHAAGQGRLDMVRMLVGAGADVDWRDVDGVSPLMRAAAGGHAGVAAYLIRAGADPMLSDRRGRRALDYALGKGKNDPVARMLHRAEINRPLKKNE